MADPIWIDANTLILVSNGDTALEGEILGYRNAGREVLITPKAWQEAQFGNPFKAKVPNNSPDRQRAVQMALAKLGVQVDRQGTRDDRIEANVKAMTIKPPPPKSSESDFVVLSEIATSAKARGVRSPVVLSQDADFRDKWAPRFGVAAVGRVSSPIPPTSSGTGSPSGPVSVGGPSAQGQALGAFAQGAHTIIKNGLTKYSQQQAYGEAMAKYEREKDKILEMVSGNPGMGAQVHFYFTVQPGVNRDFPDKCTFVDMVYALKPGPVPTVMWKTGPREELEHVTLVIPPDPDAKKPAATADTADSVRQYLCHPWDVKIGTWKGQFVFAPNGTVYWADGLKGYQHNGRWWVAAGKVEFMFDDDPADRKRQWRVTTSLYARVVHGCVLPEGVGGFFEMTRPDLAGVWVK